MAGSDIIDLDPIEPYMHKCRDEAVSLESVDEYVTKITADIKRSKAKAANIVAYILVMAIILSLPFSVFAVCLADPEYTDQVVAMSMRWYDIVAPLFGAVIGALFGISVAGGSRGDG